MNHHDNIAVREADKITFVPVLETFGDKLSIPHTVAHFVSPQEGNVSWCKEDVAYYMSKYGMDVIQICGDQLAEEEGVGELGLILEHQADVESIEFEDLVDDIKLCLHQLGWNYDGWVGENDEELGEFEENITIH